MRLTLIISLLLSYFSLAAQPTDTSVLELLDAYELLVTAGVPYGGDHKTYTLTIKYNAPISDSICISNCALILKTKDKEQIGAYESVQLKYQTHNVNMPYSLLSNDTLKVIFQHYYNRHDKSNSHHRNLNNSPRSKQSNYKKKPKKVVYPNPFNCLRLVTSVGIIDIPISNWRFEIIFGE